MKVFVVLSTIKSKDYFESSVYCVYRNKEDAEREVINKNRYHRTRTGIKFSFEEFDVFDHI